MAEAASKARSSPHVAVIGDETSLRQQLARILESARYRVTSAADAETGVSIVHEHVRMQEHPDIGGRICEPLQAARRFAPIIRHHHEHWDGKGYPAGLRGEAIPLGARIVSIADAYDAITFGRPYRRARSHEEAVEELKRCSGSQFDPALVPLFLDETERVASGLPPAADLPLAALLERHVPLAPRPVRAA